MKNTTSKKFIQVAEKSVCSEVTNYFPDMNFCRQLRRHGPAVDTAPHSSSNNHQLGDVGGGGEASSTMNRKRSNIVELLMRETGTHLCGRARDGLAVMDPTRTRKRSRSGCTVGVQTREEAQRSRRGSRSSSSSKGTAPPHALQEQQTTETLSVHPNDRYKVRCDRCQTKILFLQKCKVLKGHHTVWAESRATIWMEPTAPLPGSVANHHKTSAIKKKSSNDGKKENNATEDTSSSTSSTMEVTFHSLHIVNDDVATHKRESSFALQSVFQPSRFLSLECYPHQMLHFSLACYALWHQEASSTTSTTTPTFTNHPSPLSSCSSSSTAAAASLSPTDLHGERKAQKMETDGVHLASPTSSMAAAGVATAATTSTTTTEANEHAAVRLPSADGDAVLVLGLGGNVMGRCLDTILPPAVRLDVVEVEPTVVAACVAHGQVPPLTSWVPLEPACTAAAHTARATASLQCAFPSQAGGRGLRYRFILGDAHRFLAEGVSAAATTTTTTTSTKTPPTALNMNNLQYNLIYLDCYDPDREAMLCGAGLVELCRARLRPGGCLVINAHLLPRREHLVTIVGEVSPDRKQPKNASSSNGATHKSEKARGRFATVQALRVSGCDQSIIVCVAPDGATPEHEEGEAEEEKVHRFTLTGMRTMAEQINRSGLLRCRRVGVDTQQQQQQTDGGGDVGDGEMFYLDTNWLRRNSKLPPTSSSSSSSSYLPDCRVWEHY